MAFVYGTFINIKAFEKIFCCPFGVEFKEINRILLFDILNNTKIVQIEIDVCLKNYSLIFEYCTASSILYISILANIISRIASSADILILAWTLGFLNADKAPASICI